MTEPVDTNKHNTFTTVLLVVYEPMLDPSAGLLHVLRGWLPSWCLQIVIQGRLPLLLAAPSQRTIGIEDQSGRRHQNL